MKLSEGFTKLLPSILVVVLYGLSFVLLALALKTIEVSISYAVWSGIGMALITVVGFICFKEPITVMKMVSIGLIVAGVVGLSLNVGTR
jgi:small multidrug resistance pump